MLYLWLKALHVGAVLVFMGGILAMSVVAVILTRATDSANPQDRSDLIEAVIRWDRRLSSPALGLVWALGIALGAMGGWFSSPWLIVKLCFAVFLSALHGMLSGTLRRMGRDKGRVAPRRLRVFPAAIVVSAIAIAILVVVKPF